jgi:hypothetical protein
MQMPAPLIVFSSDCPVERLNKPAYCPYFTL